MKLPLILTFVAMTMTPLHLKADEVKDWLKNGLIHPKIIMEYHGDLDLSAEQQEKIHAIIEAAKPKVEPLESAVKSQQERLIELVRKEDTTSEAAGSQLAKVLAAESELKQFQLRTMIDLRLLLTADQRAKALSLGGKATGSDPTLEAKVHAEAKRLKEAFDELDVPPTNALKERGAALAKMIADGNFKEATEAMAVFASDTGIDTPATVEEVDFSNLNAGATELPELKQRLETLQSKAQDIISVPVIRKLLKARDALEKAKEAEDAQLIGKILTYGESLLPKE
jgi:Spy/CpxP family protein refolding chaperone